MGKEIASTLVLIGLALIGCNSTIRDIDLESKRFAATFNIDSTQGLDTTNLDKLINAKTIYSFDKAGRGTQHTQLGMVSKDTAFSWQVAGNSLKINNQIYAVEKINNGYKLKSDSALIYLTQQP